MHPAVSTGPVFFPDERDSGAGSAVNLVEIMLAGAAGGFCLALVQLLTGYQAVVHSDNPDTKTFLKSQIIPFVGLTVLGAIVAWVTSIGPISPFISGVGAITFILVLVGMVKDDEEASHG